MNKTVQRAILHGSDGASLQLYETAIARKFSNGTVALDSGGHRTSTTKNWMNEFARQECAGDFVVFSKAGVWYVIENIDRPSSEWVTREFHDGMRILTKRARGA